MSIAFSITSSNDAKSLLLDTIILLLFVKSFYFSRKISFLISSKFCTLYEFPIRISSSDFTVLNSNLNFWSDFEFEFEFEDSSDSSDEL